MTNVNLTNNEIWKILDAIKVYQKDYAVNGAVQKTFSNIIFKLEKIVNAQIYYYWFYGFWDSNLCGTIKNIMGV